MTEGPAAGLAILDRLAAGDRLATWPPLHVARAALLQRLGRDHEAVSSYRAALDLGPPPAERALLARRIADLPPSNSSKRTDGLGHDSRP